MSGRVTDPTITEGGWPQEWTGPLLFWFGCVLVGALASFAVIGATAVVTALLR